MFIHVLDYQLVSYNVNEDNIIMFNFRNQLILCDVMNDLSKIQKHNFPKLIIFKTLH